MKITIYGTGYVGLVTGTCLAELGHHVLCVDINADKIARLQAGDIPIYEPDLEALVQKNIERQHLLFTTDAKQGVAHADIQIIAVNTPTLSTGAADITHVLTVATTIAKNMQSYKLIINKSTAPVGTVSKIKNLILQHLLDQTIHFDIAANPEFLKEGAAVKDFLQPDRIIMGIESPTAKELLSLLYSAFPSEKLLFMDIASAELTKYAANALLATKISFINEIANIAEKVGADIENVKLGIGSDPRIGPHFINPGCGYGGSCFPKDVQALSYYAESIGVTPHILRAIEKVNQQQKLVLVDKIKQHFHDDLSNKTFALWGLAFKPNTNDMREASSLVIIDQLLKAGANIQAYDPIAMDEAKTILQGVSHIEFVTSATAALENADALIIVTEWDEFKNSDPEMILNKLNSPVIFDGRNIFDPTKMQQHGIIYYSIGRINRGGNHHAV